eukprot:1018555-Rhodomonas_salina.2
MHTPPGSTIRELSTIAPYASSHHRSHRTLAQYRTPRSKPIGIQDISAIPVPDIAQSARRKIAPYAI